MNCDEKNMLIAMDEALKAYKEKEVPIGAVLIEEESGILVCKNHNRMEQLDDATAHAEILVLQEATKKIGRRNLKNCTMYVTIEPCPMCAGALFLSRINRVVYGGVDSKFGAAESLFNILNNPALNHQIKVTAGILENECTELMKKFFAERREILSIKQGTH